MKAIIFAMNKEAAPLMEATTLLERKKHGAAIYERRRGEKGEFILIVSGIGKTLSAMAVSALPLLYPEVDALYSFGLSGSLDEKKLPPFSFFLPTSFVHHDIDTSAFGDPMGLFFDPNIVYFMADTKLHGHLLSHLPKGADCLAEGVEAAGDSFISDEAKKAFLRKEWKAVACDMETASIASAAKLLSLPFAAVRIISDSSSSAAEYERNTAKAVKMLTEYVLMI